MAGAPLTEIAGPLAHHTLWTERRNVLRKLKGRLTRKPSPTPPSEGRAPAWWVRLFLAVGRPLVVLVGLAVLAPAERHLAVVAGYGQWTSWGVAVLVSAYGGMAALTAAYVDRAHPDRATALWGAVGALGSGALSQVFAHLITTGYIGVEPRPPLWLVILPSVAPVFIVGHVLHLSWVRPGKVAETAPTGPETAQEPAEAPEVIWDPVKAAQADWADLLTYEQVAGLTGRADSTVRGWVHTKKVAPVMRDGKPYIRRGDIPVALAQATQPELAAA